MSSKALLVEPLSCKDTGGNNELVMEILQPYSLGTYLNKDVIVIVLAGNTTSYIGAGNATSHFGVLPQ